MTPALQQLTKEIKDALVREKATVIEIGEKMLAARKELTVHGNFKSANGKKRGWTKYVKEELGMSRENANRYIRAAQNQAKLKAKTGHTVPALSLRKTQELLRDKPESAPPPPAPDRLADFIADIERADEAAAEKELERDPENAPRLPPKPIDKLTYTSFWYVDEIYRSNQARAKKLFGEDGYDGVRKESGRKDSEYYTGTYSVFAAHLVQKILHRWGGEAGGAVLDLFAGGPPRGIMCAKLGYEYDGIDLSEDQIANNCKVAEEYGYTALARYHVGDGTKPDAVLSTDAVGTYQLGLTCPPYWYLEEYSDKADDLSTKEKYRDFNNAMKDVAAGYYRYLKPLTYACIVVGNMRYPKSAEMIDLRGDTVTNFRNAGFYFHDEAVLKKNAGAAPKRAGMADSGNKLVRVHESLLVFQKPR
jgi:hypothetical protein